MKINLLNKVGLDKLSIVKSKIKNWTEVVFYYLDNPSSNPRSLQFSVKLLKRSKINERLPHLRLNYMTCV